MKINSIHELLAIIDEWVSALPDDGLGEQCRKSGSSFFAFMTSRGVNAGRLATLIKKATGFDPRSLYSRADAATLRDAIFRYEASQGTVEHGFQTTKESLRSFWED